MRFIDEAKIEISAGHGGKGCVAFRREKYEPRGGPNGGDGGKGGDITFQATHDLSTLQDFRYKRVYKADDGEPGSGSNKAGHDGEDLVILVPVGTLIKDLIRKKFGRLTEDGQTWVAGHGGKRRKRKFAFCDRTIPSSKICSTR